MASTCAFCDDFSTVNARAGPYVNDVVGGVHGIFVVFHDDQRVSQIAQPLERRQQLGRCPSDAGRWTARPGYTARPSGWNRFASPDGYAAPLRRKAYPPRGRGSGSSRPTLSRKPRRASISLRIWDGDHGILLASAQGRGKSPRALRYAQIARPRRCFCRQRLRPATSGSEAAAVAGSGQSSVTM